MVIIKSSLQTVDDDDGDGTGKNYRSFYVHASFSINASGLQHKKNEKALQITPTVVTNRN